MGICGLQKGEEDVAKLIKFRIKMQNKMEKIFNKMKQNNDTSNHTIINESIVKNIVSFQLLKY